MKMSFLSHAIKSDFRTSCRAPSLSCIKSLSNSATRKLSIFSFDIFHWQFCPGVHLQQNEKNSEVKTEVT